MLSIGEFARRSRLSPKALRLYDEMGILAPAQVDPATGYRWYEVDQLAPAALIALMRQVGIPLELVRQVLAADPQGATTLVRDFWERAEATHRHQNDLVGYLVDRLTGRNPIMYEVTTRVMPDRTVLCMKRHVTSHQEVWDLGKQFFGLFRDRPQPLLDGREGAPFLVYYGDISAESDGPVEFCRPVSGEGLEEIADQYPDLELRQEKAHEEAVATPGPYPQPETSWSVAIESVLTWAHEHDRQPSDLGLRLTYLFTPPFDAGRGPDVDVAVPLT